MIGIIVLFPKVDSGKSIRNILVKNGFVVNAVCTTGAQALQYASEYEDGIVICSPKYTDMVYEQLLEFLHPGMNMLVVTSQGMAGEIRDKRLTYITTPLKVFQLVEMVGQIESYLRKRIKQRKAKPKVRTPEEIELLAKAKEHLMNSRHYTEEEAHRYIQKHSMDNGTNMIETAEMILAVIK